MSKKNTPRWNNYLDQIIELHYRGFNSARIAYVLRTSYKDVDWPKSIDRQVRHVIAQHKHSYDTPSKQHSLPKILSFDIETWPILTYTWRLWNANIGKDFIVKDWGILCWSAKWLFEDKMMHDCLTEEELINRDDRRISRSIWDLIDQADVVIAHNGAKFDIKKVNTKFLEYQYGNPSPYQIIDTLAHARKRFSITSNALDYIAKNFFKIEGKMETEKGLWMKVLKDNDFSALLRMQDYCDQDVVVLENVYMKMRSWIKPHPNIALMALSLENGCPICLTNEKEICETDYNTYVNSYNAYRCKGCGHIYRERRSKTPISSNKGLKVSVPR